MPTLQLSAQGVLNQFSYDNVRLSGLQVQLGALGADQLTGTVVGAARLDYGYVAPHIRVMLGLSYFRSEFDNAARARFEQRLAALVNDPDSNFTVSVGRIFWSDLTGDLDLQYIVPRARGVTMYIGIGFGVHLRNGSGPAIDGTFVEDALDEINAGVNGTVGAEFALAPRWRFTVDGRGVLSSGLSTVSLSTGIMYRFPMKAPAR